MLRRDIEQDLVPYLIENNQSVLAYSPLQRGLLSEKLSRDMFLPMETPAPGWLIIPIKRLNSPMHFWLK
jgi:aryl-alcohol dehydrogenase-like predicted oxidoreductase